MADLHSMQPMPAVTHPPEAQERVSLGENSLCQSNTGHRSGLPGSVRRLRAGSVIMPRVLERMEASDSLRVIALPYDLDSLRPSKPGMRGVCVRITPGSRRTFDEEK